jgi:hypothetical protein
MCHEPGELFAFARRKLAEQLAESGAQESARGLEDRLARAREREIVAAAIILGPRTLNPACSLEGREELRDGGTRDAGAPGDVGRAQRLPRDRAKG